MSQAQSRLALQQNNRGAFLLTTQKFDEAIVCLSLALQASKQQLDATCKTTEVLTPDDGAMLFLDQVMSHDPELSNIMTDTDCLTEENFVYRRSISIPCRTLMDFLPDEHDRSVVISVSTIFNLALAHHLRAMEQDERQSKKLQLKRAVLLYELAYKLQIEGITGAGLSTVFVMATLNNLGQIHKILQERDTASKCFENLLSTLMFAVDAGGILPSSEMDGFFRTISFLIFRAPSAGAA